MYQTTIAFTNATTGNASVGIMSTANLMADASSLYSEEKGYGFVIERNRNEQELLQLPELNSAFSTWYWDNGKELTVLKDTDAGATISDSSAYEPAVLPLSFKLKLPHQGNYQLTLTVTAGEKGCDNLTVFTGRRHLAVRNVSLQAKEVRTLTFTVNVCDIIPRGKEEAYTDTTLDITLFGSQVALTALTVEEVDVHTIYIAGDSTVTDQSGAYPYDAGCCYSGWGQMLSAYLKPGIAVSNHAHSGLTTESFRSEGHYDIVKRFIKKGDYYLMQFAHNDQKLPHLDAAGGYRARLIAYVEEIRSVGGIPVIVTPLARNTWKGDGTYNDLLVNYAAECIRVGKEYDVPVIDLHKFSMDFVLKEGLDSAKRYYYPKDYTHTNDYGAYLMAECIASGLAQIEELKDFVISEAP
ncbi:MAG: rhamnogalacturonan acetylesterase, partial [Lachnospiraceae bacterium]|nr:rhamnogalacturonan acetylesterase [Lachnospiraceae bacterium]